MGGRENRVVAFAGILDHCVTDIVDEVDVAAAPAIHRIGTGVTVEQIVAGIAVEHVAQDVAVCLQIGAPLQDQVLYVRRQPEMGGRINRVDAVVGVFDHGVADIVYEVRVVPGAAGHEVGVCAALQDIVGRGHWRCPTTIFLPC